LGSSFEIIPMASSIPHFSRLWHRAAESRGTSDAANGLRLPRRWTEGFVCLFTPLWEFMRSPHWVRNLDGI
jgi:hypothetical protein